jgi:DnaJ-class molecular chaperone
MDYYKILNISENTTLDEIKKSYRKKTLEYYKNNNKNTEILNEAYNYLIDNHDKITTLNNVNIDNIHKIKNIDISEKIYRENSEINNKEIPQDIIINKNITLKESYSGYMIPINIERSKIVNNSNYTEYETIYVTLPKGIDNNEIILLEKKGNIVNNLKGDVKVVININETFNFSRSGLDLYYHKNISLKQALCGFKFNIQYLNNENIVINNEKGNIIHPITTKIIKNFGMERDNMKGNLIIIFDISYPDYIDKNSANKLEKIFNDLS